jgi:hypothetical protein
MMKELAQKLQRKNDVERSEVNAAIAVKADQAALNTEILNRTNAVNQKADASTAALKSDTVGYYAKYRAGLLSNSTALGFFESINAHIFDRDVTNQAVIDTAAKIRADLSNQSFTIPNNSIEGYYKLMDGSVSAIKIAPYSISNGQISSLSGNKIEDNSIYRSKLTDGAIDGSKFDHTGATNGQVYAYNSATNAFSLTDMPTTPNLSNYATISSISAKMNYSDTSALAVGIRNSIPSSVSDTSFKTVDLINNNTKGGAYSMFNVLYGAQNVALGVNALKGSSFSASNSTGYNTAIGYNALKSQQSTGGQNTAIGNQAMPSNTTGSNNTGVGTNIMWKNTTGHENTAIGKDALFNNTVGNTNIAIGWQALTSNTTGSNSTAIGTGALLSNTTAWGNTAIGNQSLYSNTTAQGNVAIGDSSSYNTNTGGNNTSIGYKSLANNISGANNTSIGSVSLFNAIGTANTAVGAMSATAVSSGNNNTVVGSGSGNSITTGSYNIIIGQNLTVPFGTSDNQLNIGGWISGTNGAISIPTSLSVGAFKMASGGAGSGKVLTSDASGNATWQTASGGSTTNSIIAKSTSATLTTSEAGTIKVSGQLTLTLPTAASALGLKYTFIKTDAAGQYLQLDAVSGELINADPSRFLTSKWEKFTIQSDGTMWLVVAQ